MEARGFVFNTSVVIVYYVLTTGVGMHKHFRILAISDHMKSQGYAPANEQHTRIPGIWKKLGTLYNLPALDERVGSSSKFSCFSD
jgi:Chromatin modification-related protein EAF7